MDHTNSVCLGTLMLDSASTICLPAVNKVNDVSVSEFLNGLTQEPKRLCSMRCAFEEAVDYLDINTEDLDNLINGFLSRFSDFRIALVSNWLADK